MTLLSLERIYRVNFKIVIKLPKFRECILKYLKKGLDNGLGCRSGTFCNRFPDHKNNFYKNLNSNNFIADFFLKYLI